MKVSIKASIIYGNVTAPASKSAMQRACALALIHNGTTIIENFGISNDDKAALGIVQALGATVKYLPDTTLQIVGGQFNTEAKIFAGESGLSIRMFAPVSAAVATHTNITGEGSLLTRPMHFFTEVFPKLGVEVKSNNGLLPITLIGKLQPTNITIDGSLSSQFLTGLLIAFAAVARTEVTISVIDLKSKPYIDLTLQIMRHFGHNVTHQQYERFIISPSSPKVNKTITYTCEGDWSGAAFLLVAGAAAGEVAVAGLQLQSTQADRSIMQVLMQAGARMSITDELITVSKTVLKPFQFDATDCPDLFPPLVALAAACSGTSVITGVSRLTHKESNRALTLQDSFGKLGLQITLQDDLMIIAGGTPLIGAEASAHHDHRIAMALAVAGLLAQGEVIIDGAEAINKSYPNFYNHLQQLGAAVTMHQ